MIGLAVYRLALRFLGFRVARGDRAEWLAEWSSELWYVREAASRCDRPGQRHAAMIGFCRGAIEDTRALREHGGVTPTRASRPAVGCCVGLAVAACMVVGLAYLLPGVWRAMRPVDRGAAGSVTIASSGLPTVTLGAVRALARRPHRLFSDLAYYEPVSRPASCCAWAFSAAQGRALQPDAACGTWSTDPVFAGAGGRGARAAHDLSEATWRTQFAANSAVFGTEVRLGLQRVRLAGVVADGDVPDGQESDAWLLMPDSLADTLADATEVCFVGRVAGDAELPVHRQRWQMYVRGPGGEVDYDCTSLATTRLEPLRLFLFALFLALLSLPATTSLSLGDYPNAPTGPAFTRTAVRRWLFLAAKIGLVLPTIYFGTLDVVYVAVWRSTTVPEYVQLAVSFAACLFALRWALRDQRQRCPVCLGRLRCPARVGQPSRNFLAWNGTELICVAGHGLLHVPELPTSWCGTQRWLHLDASWSELFLVPG